MSRRSVVLGSTPGGIIATINNALLINYLIMSIRHLDTLSASTDENTTLALSQTTHHLQRQEGASRFVRLASSLIFTGLLAFSGGAIIAASETHLAPSVDFIVRLTK